MAEQENTEKEKAAEPKAQKGRGLAAKIVPWVITAAIVMILAGAGFLVGRLFGTRGQSQTASAAEQVKPAETTGRQGSGGPTQAGNWFYDLDAVVANLNEPGVTRYVRAGLTLEISGTLKEDEGKSFLDQRKPLMKHWLTLYLANQTTEQTRGERNLLRMQSQILDTFNAGLFPDAKPQIKRILFKEFAIQ